MKSQSMTVKQQLTLAFSLLIAACALLAGVAMWGQVRMNEQFHTFVEGVTARAAAMYELNDSIKDRAMGLRNLLLATGPDERAKFLKIVREHQVEVAEGVAKYRKMMERATDMSPKARELAENVLKVEAEYGPVALSITELALTDRDAAAVRLSSECVPMLERLDKAIEAYRMATTERSADEVKLALDQASADRVKLIAVTLLALALAVSSGMWISRRLSLALGAEPAVLNAVVARVADGDLSGVVGAAQAPVGSVMAAMGRMQGNLVALISQVRTSADSIATASAQIATGNQDLSSRTESQASALQQTSAQMHQMTDTVRQSASGARQASQLAEEAAGVASQGGAVVQRVVSTMGEITDASRRIGDIIGVIDGIAFQTNILALNAAVEAARAGEQGRGFAVVAAEVRSLAQRSAAAAREIKTLIGNSVERVEAGSKLVDEAGFTMTEIVSHVRKVTDLISEIHQATEQQSAGIEQVNQAVASLDQGTQQNAALVEQSAAAAESLRQQAGDMTRLVGQFKT
jgi:methyl-accepting chemotaxis protein-1 (serine sensor receptor)